MTVKKPVPCSVYDIPGMQEWLDEMALQGLFLKEFSYHSDRAVFEQGEPRPVRYRLDPIPKDKTLDRDEPYAEMGWEFVCQLARHFYIYSCGDPEAPELHSDPASLSYALQTLIRRKIRDTLLFFGVMAALVGAVFLMEGGDSPANLILMEYPLRPFIDLFLLVLLAVLLLDCTVHVRRLLKTRRTLDDGLLIKAGRRHWRPNVPYLALYFPFMLLLNLLTSYAMHYTTVEYLELNLAALSHPWPSLVLLEKTQPSAAQPEHYSYMTVNRSSAAPVQEHYTDRGAGFGLPFLKVWYYQTSFPDTARQLYRLTRKDLEKELRHYNSFPNSSESISELTPFAPREYPGLDALETASFRYSGLEGWAVTLRRGNDVLLIRYAGSASPEDCLELFLEALDGKDAAS